MDVLLTEFVYKNAKGETSTRSISNISESGKYIQGFCHTAVMVRTFRKDRIVQILNNPHQINLLATTTELDTPQSNQRSKNELDVCFTGFNAEDKRRLTELALSKDMVIRKSVTVNLAFLCCGINAGPSKCDKAREQGVLALNEYEFISLLETGEVPNS